MYIVDKESFLAIILLEHWQVIRGKLRKRALLWIWNQPQSCFNKEWKLKWSWNNHKGIIEKQNNL